MRLAQGNNMALSTPSATTRIVAPEPNKWNETRSAVGALRFVCRPFACPEPALVDVVQVPVTRVPEDAELQKFARELIPNQIKMENTQAELASRGTIKFRLLNSAVTRSRGYPAVLSEVERLGVGAPERVIRMTIFVQNNRIQISSASRSPKLARANLDSFIAAIDIVDLKNQSAQPTGGAAPASRSLPASAL